MSPRPYLVALFFGLWALHFGSASVDAAAGAADNKDLMDVLQKLTSAIEKKDAQQAQAQFTQAVWARATMALLTIFPGLAQATI